ncbi:hypothetical protein WN944_018541 [Citrus x changshan-huyou]|uniref:Uncharacterized protein n=1 Tax=Citrus x changshan-huyou TaxID=2935761 RepID=A0AAP0LX02_9ROSI
MGSNTWVVFYCPLIISFNFLLFINFANDRIIARLQQPYSLEHIPLEAEYQVGDPVKHAFNNQTGNVLKLSLRNDQMST